MAKNFDPEIGKDTRWRKGQRSPNPGGRPRYRVVSAYLRQALESGDADRIACSLLKLAKNGNMRAISEVIDRTEGKATQIMEVAGENSRPDSPDIRDVSKEELVERIIELGVHFIRQGLESLHEQHLRGEKLQLLKAAPRLRELQQGLTSLVEVLAEQRIPPALEHGELVENKNEGMEPAERRCWRTEQISAGGGSVRLYVGP